MRAEYSKKIKITVNDGGCVSFSADATVALTLYATGGGGMNEATTTTGLLWLLGYIVLNLVTTILNKAIFTTFDWPFPMSLALVH